MTFFSLFLILPHYSICWPMPVFFFFPPYLCRQLRLCGGISTPLDIFAAVYRSVLFYTNASSAPRGRFLFFLSFGVASICHEGLCWLRRWAGMPAIARVAVTRKYSCVFLLTGWQREDRSVLSSSWQRFQWRTSKRGNGGQQLFVFLKNFASSFPSIGTATI